MGTFARLLYLAYDVLTGRRLYNCRNMLEKSQWMKKKELQKLQMRKLGVLLRHAYENVPYYHESFKKNSFHPDDFRTFRDLQKIPILHRSELRLKSNALMARNAEKSELVSCKTSGTTATPVKFYRSNIDFTWDLAAELRGYSWAGFETGSKLVYIRLFEGRNDVLAGVKHRLRRSVIRWKLLGGYDF